MQFIVYLNYKLQYNVTNDIIFITVGHNENFITS